MTWLDLTGGRVAQLAAAPLLVAERRPPVLRHFSQPGQRRALRDLLTSGRFSAVVADTPYATGALPPRDPRASGQTPLIVNTHNVESEVWQAAAPDVSGGRLRLALEALAYARAVVASAKAVEGLGMTPEVHYLPAEDEAALASQLGRLAADVRLRDELARRGRALVEARYSWASAGAAFLALLADCGVRVADPAPRRRA